MSEELRIAHRPGREDVLPVAADATIYRGHLVAINAAGFARPAAAQAGLQTVGVADQSADNSGGADGDLQIRILRDQCFVIATDEANPPAPEHYNQPCHVKDSETVKFGGGAIVAGIYRGSEGNDHFIQIGGPFLAD